MKNLKSQMQTWSNLKTYWIKKKGYAKVPKSKMAQFTPECIENIKISEKRLARIAKYGPVTNKERYHSQKHNNRSVAVPGVKHLKITYIPGHSPFWQAAYTKFGHATQTSLETEDEAKAFILAVKWFNREVVPVLHKNSSINVLKYVKENFIYLGKSKWYPDKVCFDDLPPCNTNSAGVYVIMHGNRIHKVGKADGVKGLKQRIASYAKSKLSNITRANPDIFTVALHNKMTSELEGKTMSFYFMETPKGDELFNGLQVEKCVARSVEKELSMLARLQSHPMLLSASD